MNDNYLELVELMRSSSIICVVDYDHCRDVAHTIYRNTSAGEEFEVSVRGLGYITAFSEDDFITGCKSLNLRYLE